MLLQDSLEQIAQFPEIGRSREFSDKRFQNVRMWHVIKFEKYLIFYEEMNDRIEVIRVLHGSRDIDALFE